jgi:hypothetical protein
MALPVNRVHEGPAYFARQYEASSVLRTFVRPRRVVEGNGVCVTCTGAVVERLKIAQRRSGLLRTGLD